MMMAFSQLMTQVTLEPCHHEVCSSCLVGMLGLLGARVCPICRSPIVRYHQLPEPAAAAGGDKEVRAPQLFETHRYKYWILDISHTWTEYVVIEVFCRDELCHRLRRVYERFPGVITEKRLGEATLAVDRGTLADFERVVPVSWRSGSSAVSSTKTTEGNSDSNSGGGGGQ